MVDEAEADPPGPDPTITTTKNTTKSLRETVRLKKNEPNDRTAAFEVEAAEEVEDEEAEEVSEVEAEDEAVTEEVPLVVTKVKTKKLPTPKTTKTVNKLRATDPDRKPDEAVNDHEVVSEVEAEEVAAEDEEAEDEAEPVTKASLAPTKTPLQLPPPPLQPPLLQPQKPRHQNLKTKFSLCQVKR